MAKRGRCRCGTLLVFQRMETGYKTKCPVCQSVVRLRAEERKNRPPPTPPMLPAAPAPPPVPVDATPPDFGLLETHETTAPIAQVEMEVYREPDPAPWLRRLGWWALPLLVVAVLFTLIVAALLRG